MLQINLHKCHNYMSYHTVVNTKTRPTSYSAERALVCVCDLIACLKWTELSTPIKQSRHYGMRDCINSPIVGENPFFSRWLMSQPIRSFRNYELRFTIFDAMQMLIWLLRIMFGNGMAFVCTENSLRWCSDGMDCVRDRLHVFAVRRHCISSNTRASIYDRTHREIIDISCGESPSHNVDTSRIHAENGQSVICQSECIA